MSRLHAAARLLMAFVVEVAALLFMWSVVGTTTAASTAGPFTSEMTQDPLGAVTKVAGWASVAILGYLIVVTALQLLALTVAVLAPKRSIGAHIASASARLGPRAFAGLAAAATLAGVTACGPATTSPGSGSARAAPAGAREPVVMVLDAPLDTTAANTPGSTVAPGNTVAPGGTNNPGSTGSTDASVTMYLDADMSGPGTTVPVTNSPAAPHAEPAEQAPATAAPATAAPSTAALAISEPATAAPVPTEVTVARGDSLWSIAEDALSDRLGRPATPTELDQYWHSVVEINRTRLVDPSNPGLIYPGQRFALP